MDNNGKENEIRHKDIDDDQRAKTFDVIKSVFLKEACLILL